MAAYYNEFDPFAAAWLRELISNNLIAPGEVDERSITEVSPDDLRGFDQCHFFAGIGVWSHALRGAGWADDRPIWTGSCPCQPFSAAGKGGGFDDERHLWPAFFNLIRERRPDVVLGEQVASKDGLSWLDLVYADLEGADYAVGAADTCAAGFGAPHIRQRLYWCGLRSGLAHTDHNGHERASVQTLFGEGRREERDALGRSCAPLADRVANTRLPSTERQRKHGGEILSFAKTEGFDLRSDAVGQLADAAVVGRLGRGTGQAGDEPGTFERSERLRDADRPGPTNGHWRDADWLGCRDGKWRPVEPGTFPLAHGASARVGRLRGYGNAIVAPQAQAFVEGVIDWFEFGDLI